MGDHSHIEWTDATWNPLRGCTRVSAGCQNCYAERQAIRHAGPGGSYEDLVRIANGHPQWTGAVRFVREHLLDPLRWKTPRRIFVNSMSDLFHENVPDHWRDLIFAVMARAWWHEFQILTKRPAIMQRYMREIMSEQGGLRIGEAWSEEIFCVFHKGVSLADQASVSNKFEWHELPNVWLGVSCENQATADERIPLLLQTPAAVRWISAEPLLGPIDLEKPFDEEGNRPPICELDWIVVGGESGPGARCCRLEWIQSIVEQCAEAGVPVFVKQLGSNPWAYSGVMHAVIRWDAITDRKGGDLTEFPPHLRIRQYPQPTGKEVHA